MSDAPRPTPWAMAAVLVTIAAVLAALVFASDRRQVGDSGEYVAVALNLSAGRPPAMSAADILDVKARFDGWALSFPVVFPQFLAHGRQDMEHFWLYPLLAAPIVWTAGHLGIHPAWAFALLNAMLLLGAAWCVQEHVGWLASLLLSIGPIIWWIDKAHTEVLLFAALVSAFALLRRRPWWSLCLVGVAAAQNPALGLLLPIVLVAAMVESPAGAGDVGLWLGLWAGASVAAMHPLYYFLRLGVATPLSASVERHWPSAGEFLAPLLDPNIGLLSNAPATFLALAFVVFLVLARAPRKAASPGPTAAVVGVLGLLLVASQTTNLNHGGTRGVSRYALWLIPLAVPWLDAARGLMTGRAGTAVRALVTASCIWSLVDYFPRQPETFTRPTWLASALWTRYPGLYDPPPEIFTERLSANGREAQVLPIATPTCSKVLLRGGAWPLPCPPVAVPPPCTRETALCYANRTATGYRFVTLPPAASLAQAVGGPTWPEGLSAQQRLRDVLTRASWEGLRRNPGVADGAYIRSTSDIGGLFVLQGADRLVAFIRLANSGARLRVRLPQRMTGTVLELDADREHALGGTLAADDLVEVPIPAGRNLVFVAEPAHPR